MNVKTIAEIGSVHDGSFGNCLKLIELAKNCGADVVKFQYHIAEYETLTYAEGPSYFNDEKRFDYFERTSFTLTQWKKIINHCKKKKIKFLCSVFSIESFKNLLSLGVKSFKVPSGEVTNLPLLDEMSKKKNIKIFLSTGMSNYKEIDKAYKILKNNKLVIMQCTSLYPCPSDKVGINVIKKLKNKYKFCEIGFSDHTTGNVSAILAIANGATYFEKHLTFSRKMYGSDAQFASEPDELSNYCESLKKAEIILSKDVNKDDLRPLVQMRKVFQKSILYSNNFKKGKKITLKDVVFLKPDKGISAQNYKSILGKKIKREVKKNEFVKYSDFS